LRIELPDIICRAVEVAPPPPAPMLGHILIVVRDTPAQLMVTEVVISVFAPDSVSTLTKTTGEILKLQDCASAPDGASNARQMAISRLTGKPRR
jgi:hypothetical protein